MHEVTFLHSCNQKKNAIAYDTKEEDWYVYDVRRNEIMTK